jgi:hypothetical protein
MTGTCEDAVCRYGKGTANRPDAFARNASERSGYCITNDMQGFTPNASKKMSLQSS